MIGRFSRRLQRWTADHFMLKAPARSWSQFIDQPQNLSKELAR